MTVTPEMSPTMSLRPANHTYSLSAIGLMVKMVLDGAVSFRACSAVVKLFREFLPPFPTAPAPNTAQSWLLRLGLHELQRPKEQAEDWVFLVDHTLQLGAWKCLLIVGIRQSSWEQIERPLTHQDLALLTLEPVAKSDGDTVYRQLEIAAEKVGVPASILSEGGPDITNGAAKFREQHSQTRVQKDIAHKAANLLKQELLADSRWEEFVKHCGQTQPKVKQTELGNLAPPTLKVKARYMNLGPLIGWGARMLRLVETPAPKRPQDLNLSRLEEKFGWIRDYRQALVDWNDLQAVIDCVLKYARIQGYHAGAANELRIILGPIVGTAAGERLAAALVEFVEQQSDAIPRDTSLPASSEVLESLIGKGKRLQGQHSRGGFTKMVLGMAASVVQVTHDRIREALQTVRNADLHAWCQQNLGTSLTAQRRQALPAPLGTKTG
jgi:hypothetical protein